MTKPKVGDRVTFTPAAFQTLHTPHTVRGVIVYVNEAHRFYQVAYAIGDTILGEGLKF